MTHENIGQNKAIVDRTLKFSMTELSYLLQKLTSTPDGSGNLLDHCCIYITSCIGNAAAHSHDGNLLQMIAGKAGGALKDGIHVAASDTMATAVPYTAMHAVGVQLPQFGSRGMEVDQPIQALLA